MSDTILKVRGGKTMNDRETEALVDMAKVVIATRIRETIANGWEGWNGTVTVGKLSVNIDFTVKGHLE